MNDQRINGSRRAPTGEPHEAETFLVTGFPAFTARRMVAEILASSSDDDRVLLLARKQFGRGAREFLRSLGADAEARSDVVIGDVCSMDLGLAGEEFSELAERTTTIHHLAGIYFMGVDRATAQTVNVDGTRGVIAFANDCSRLRRLCHWSTAFVSGKRKGVILEEELDAGQGFNNFWEETKFEAEALARTAQELLPITILRPGVIVGDSRTGEIDEFDGPHALITSALAGKRGIRMPLPARGSAPMHLVPIDYVTRAAFILGSDQRGAGQTFHLTDSDPLPASRVFALVAELAQLRSPTMMSPSLARTMLKAPGLARLTRAPRAVLDAFDHRCTYNARGAAKILFDHGIRCPSFDDYAEALVAFAQKRAGSAPGDVDDPLL